MFRHLPVALLALLTAACATPLGPGFHTEKEFLEVRFVPGSSPHLEIRATFTLKNSGNASLDAMDVALPDEKDFGLQNLRITVDGAAVSSSPASTSEPDNALHVPLPAPWPQKTKRIVVVSYHLVASPGAAQRIGLDAASFSLTTDGWYPQLRAPKGFFAKGSSRARRFDLSVRVPENFLVHAAGRPRGKKHRAAESEFRFRIAPDDFSPFVVAGRYLEQKFSDSSGTVLFWTLQLLPADQVARAGPRLTAALRIYESAFGPRAGGPRPIRLMESMAADPGPWFGRAFPDGTLLWGDVFRRNSFDEVATLQMARLWFGQSLTARPETRLLLGPAAATYASILVSEAREGEAARRRHAAALIEQYQKSLHGREEKPLVGDFGKYPDVLLAVPSGTVSLETSQRDAAIAKGALFFLALEDEFGKQIVHHALARMIHAMRGQQVGIHELRSALETESGKPLGEFFRLWLNHRGIPADFRARYADQKSREQK